MPVITEEERNAVIALIKAILEAIREAGEKGIPSGHLYAVLMGKMSLSTYENIIASLKERGLIAESNNRLKTT